MIDALLANDALTLPCTLVYGDTNFTPCPNCIYDTLLRKSSNRYKQGGPVPFQFGTVCPYCGGKGLIATTSSEELYMAVIWDYKSWINIDLSVHTPDGKVQTLSKIDTFPQVKRAKEIIIANNIQNYAVHRFQRANEPQPCGFGATNYIATLWKRIG